MSGHGVRADSMNIHWPELMRFKQSFTSPVPENREARFADSGIEIFHGRARFTGPTTVEVDSDVLHAEKIVIATGATPAPLNIPGAEASSTSDQFLELTDLPPHIVFIGGGYVSFELAQGQTSRLPGDDSAPQSAAACLF